MARVLVELEGQDAIELLERVMALESNIEELKDMVDEIKELVSKPKTRTKKSTS
jgi:hypothetical protein